MGDIKLPDPAYHEVYNVSTYERQLSDTGVAYYGSNWRLGRPLYTADQVRAAILADRRAQAQGGE